MPTIRKRPRKRGPVDLFGEIPVTWPEVLTWCAVIAPHISPGRLSFYINGWNVPDKVRNAKHDGTFAAILAGRESQLFNDDRPRLPVRYAAAKSTITRTKAAARSARQARRTSTPPRPRSRRFAAPLGNALAPQAFLV